MATAGRSRWIVAALVVLVAATAVSALLPGAATQVRTARVTRSTLRVSVSCSGELRPPRAGELHAPEAGRVAALEVAEGAQVRAGQLLLRLASPELVSQQLAAHAELAQLEAERQSALADELQARAEFERRGRTAEQDTRLLKAQAISAQAAEASAAELQTARARLEAAVARAASVDPGRAASRLALARARAAQLDARVASLQVRAPIDGTVFGLPPVGEAVSLGQRLGGLARPDRPRLLVRVDEPDVPRVAAGQQLLVTFDGLPDRRFPGKLLGLDRGLRPSEGRVVAEGEGELSDPDHLLPLNAGVGVEVIVGQRAEAMVVPRGALQRDGDLRYVLLLRGGRAERRPIRVGLIGLSEVEVLDGLSVGEEVILPGAAVIAPGQRARARAG